MHVEVGERRVEARPGGAVPVVLTVSNSRDVIAGYAVRVLGADPGWVELTDSDLSLFPDESRVVTALVTVPMGVPAGERRVAVQVRELTSPEHTTIEEIVLVVPEDSSAQVRLDPAVATAGSRARFGLLVDNNGNTTLSGVLVGADPESKVRFRFDPPTLTLQPGEHAVVDLTATSRRPLAGSPVVRPLEVHLVDPPEATGAETIDTATGNQRRAGRRTASTVPIPSDNQPVATGSFVQRARFTRGAFTLLGLLVAITVFALVITFAFSKVLGQSAADRNLALKIASASDAGTTSGTSGLSGVVRQRTSGAPVAGVTVSIFDASDTSRPIVTDATTAAGTYRISNLPRGDYKVSFRGAGFLPVWFPQALDEADGETVTLDANTLRNGLDVALGGVPATISGKVKGDDVSTAVLTLKAPGLGGSTAPVAAGSRLAAEEGATVTSVPIGTDGTFTLTDVPSPSVYDLVVTKAGFATATQRVDVGAGEERKGVEITLLRGDGLISGTVSSSKGPLGEVSITARSGQATVTTMSLTDGDAGSFSLRGLPTPGTFTVEASKEGHASQTVTLTLAEGQQLTGVALVLGTSSGSLTGLVTEQVSKAKTRPASGVTVVVTDGQRTVQTVTRSSDELGRWVAAGLAVPGTYTVTLRRPDLESQTVSVALDAGGGVVVGDHGGATVGAGGITVSMKPATATLEGRVTQYVAAGSKRHEPIGEVTVQLSSGTSTYTVTTASVPAADRGRYSIEGLPPGTYTASVSRSGVSPTSEIFVLGAGDVEPFSPILAAAASVSGKVVDAQTGVPVAAGMVVQLFRASDYPLHAIRVTTTAAGGRFEFPDVDAPETYVVQARPTLGSAPVGSTTVQIEGSQQLSVTVKVSQ